MVPITRIPEPPPLTLEEQYDLYRAGVADASGDAIWPKTSATADLLDRFRARLFYETIGDLPAALGDAPDWLRALVEDDEPPLLSDELPGHLLRLPRVAGLAASLLRTHSVR